jgi:hypothetical protein
MSRFKAILWMIDNHPHYGDHLQEYVQLDNFPPRL